jgi:hypothetical protein
MTSEDDTFYPVVGIDSPYPEPVRKALDLIEQEQKRQRERERVALMSRSRVAPKRPTVDDKDVERKRKQYEGQESKRARRMGLAQVER